MFLKTLAILLISAVLFKPAAGLYMVIDYEVNKDYFAKYLCENQDKPELKCQGKCFLMQKLKKNSAKNEAHQTEKLNQISKVEMMDVAKILKIRFSKSFLLSTHALLKLVVLNGHLHGVFHPPSFL